MPWLSNLVTEFAFLIVNNRNIPEKKWLPPVVRFDTYVRLRGIFTAPVRIPRERANQV